MRWLLMMAPCFLLAQDSAPVGFLRGHFVSATISDLTIEAGGQQYRCGFDRRTYIERSRQSIPASSLRVGDSVEVLADRVGPSGVCYTRMLHVLDSLRARAKDRAADGFASTSTPRGDLTFSGIILKLATDFIVIRTRLAGEKTISLRQDTRYVEEGLPVEASALGLNELVFIRAGRTLGNELEAFQVVWRRSGSLP